MDVVHICTPNHLHVPLAAGRAGRRQARDLREADRARRRRRAGARRRRRGRGPDRRRALRLPLLPDRARGARARAHGRHRPDRLLHGSYLQDWLLRPEDDNWRVDDAARRRVARVRRHRQRTGATSPSSSPATASRGCRARTLTALPERFASEAHAAFAVAPTATARRGRSPPRTPRSIQFETDRRRARLGGHQPDLGRAQEPPAARARRRRGGARVQPGGAGVAVGRPPRGGDADQARPGAPDRGRRPLRDAAAPATRRATATASTRSSPRPTPRSQPARPPDGHAGLRGRPARRAHHRRGADLGARGALGRRSRPLRCTA